uniref:Uncharacterized protein n=1 Tax=Clytia hemisphaerica TaxID=252671 RepID=A0A7M5XG84_9CNID|eukprot:TCONS_00035524-protein
MQDMHMQHQEEGEVVRKEETANNDDDKVDDDYQDDNDGNNINNNDYNHHNNYHNQNDDFLLTKEPSWDNLTANIEELHEHEMSKMFDTLNVNVDDCDINEEDFFTETNSYPYDEPKPLCRGVNMSLENSLLLHMAFSRRHNLTKAALKDLLSLTSLHLCKPNGFPTTVDQMYNVLGLQESEVTNVYYCSNCNISLDKPSDKCIHCPSETRPFCIQ